MIDGHSTLVDICFIVSQALFDHGIDAVLTGGSAATVYAPEVYTSLDADFICDDKLKDIARALQSIGFQQDGKTRLFVHPGTEIVIDFPRGPLAVGADYVSETATLTRGGSRLRILTRTDCIRDRLAHFYHWNDYTALNAAVGVAAGDLDGIDWDL